MTPHPDSNHPSGPDAMLPRALVALALAWCVVFPVLGLATTLFAFADGGIFAYAAAAGEGWAFHWRNIPGRVAAFAAAGLPGAAAARLTGDPAIGLAVYGASWLLAPALGLLATAAADRSRDRLLTLWACASTALALPLVYGFPTELWIAHAAFWPALALLHAPGGRGRTAATAAAMAVLVLSHEGGVIWAVVAVGALAPRRGAMLRGAALLGATLVPWAALKLSIAPTPYVAEVLGRNAFALLAPANIFIPMALELVAMLGAFAAGLILASRRGAGAPWLWGLAAALATLALWRALAGDALHATDRYAARTILLGVIPAAGVAAALQASGVAARHGLRPTPALARAALGAALAISAAHVVETARFAAAWSGYAAAVRVLAAGPASDADLGDPAFVSAARLADHRRLGWHSTTPFLSAVLSPSAAPARLVVDPAVNYFWFDCAVATAHRDAPGPIPEPTRALIARYVCLHQ